jgi:hypothetical protein
MPSQSATLGAAGEHFVLFQLLRPGFIAALAPQGVPMADIIVTDAVGKKLCAVQVKTRRNLGGDGGWHMKQRHETIISPSLFYCFVDVGKGVEDIPCTHVVPSKIVATALSESYADWVSKPGKNGQRRREHPMRRFVPDFSRYDCSTYPDGWLTRYREAWDLLKGAP